MSSRVLDPNIVFGEANSGYNYCPKHRLWRSIRRKIERLGFSYARCSTEGLCRNGEIKGHIHLPVHVSHVLHQRQSSSGREESHLDCRSFPKAPHGTGQQRQASGIGGLGRQELELRGDSGAPSQVGNSIKAIPAKQERIAIR